MKIEFKPVKLKKTDTCLTFVLKRLGILGGYADLDGAEFVKLFDLEEIESFEKLHRGDMIIQKSRKGYYVDVVLSIDVEGRRFDGFFNNSYHFMLFEGVGISDVGSEGIGFYDLDFINPGTSKSKFYTVRYSNLTKKTKT